MAEKSAEKSAELIPQPHGGALLPGGVKGNKGGGRKPNKFHEWCAAITEDEKVHNVLTARAKAGDLKVVEFAAGYAHGKPKQDVALTGDVTIRVEYDDERAPE